MSCVQMARMEMDFNCLLPCVLENSPKLRLCLILSSRIHLISFSISLLDTAVRQFGVKNVKIHIIHISPLKREIFHVMVFEG